MTIKTINLQVVKNLGNYESLRIGAEWSVDGEKIEDAAVKGMQELNAAADVILAGKKPEQKAAAPATPKEEFAHEFCKKWQLTQDIVDILHDDKDPNGNEKMRVTVDNPVLQKTCKRIEAGVELATALKWISPDEQAFGVLAFAAKLNER